MKLLTVVVFLLSASAISGGLQEWSPTAGIKITTPQRITVSIGLSSISLNSLQNDQTYAGVEARGGLHVFILSTGIYRHVSGGDTDHDWVFSGGAGIGF